MLILYSFCSSFPAGTEEAFYFKNTNLRDFPSGPVVKTPCFLCMGCRFESITGQGTKISHAHMTDQKKTKQTNLIQMTNNAIQYE